MMTALFLGARDQRLVKLREGAPQELRLEAGRVTVARRAHEQAGRFARTGRSAEEDFAMRRHDERAQRGRGLLGAELTRWKKPLERSGL